MEGDRTRPDPRLEEIAERLRALERRLTALEARVFPKSAAPSTSPALPEEESAGPPVPESAGVSPPESTATPLPESTAAPQPDSTGEPLADSAGPPLPDAAGEEGERIGAAGTLSLIGRTLVVLGGAFLIRAITEAKLVPDQAGTALGLAYAIFWILAADRAARGERCASATFHGVASALIAYPLLGEATIKFRFLSPPVSAFALMVVLGLALGMTWRRRLRAMAWVTVLGAAPTALVIAFATRVFVPFMSSLLLLGFATLWIGYLRGWRFLAWFVSFGLDLTLLLLTVLILTGPRPGVVETLAPRSLVGLQLSLVFLYFGSFAARTLFRGRNITFSEILQSGAVFLIGFGGAIAVTSRTEASTVPLGVAALVLAAGGYGAAFAFIDRRLGRGVNFFFYTSLGLLLMLVAAGVLLRGVALALVLALAGGVTAAVGAYRSRATLSLHSAVYFGAAAVSAGFLRMVSTAFLGGNAPLAGRVSASLVIVLSAAAVASWFPSVTHGTARIRLSRVPKFITLLILLIGTGGVVVILGSSWLWGSNETGADRAALGALRTGVLAATSVLAAWVSRWPRFLEAAWLVYPLLAAGGFKLIGEDLRMGRASTLFLSLALYGGALILAPQLARRAR